jgi:hypothetical protein
VAPIKAPTWSVDDQSLIAQLSWATTEKLNKAEQRKLQENLHNYTGIMKKFLNINLENLYANSSFKAYMYTMNL